MILMVLSTEIVKVACQALGVYFNQSGKIFIRHVYYTQLIEYLVDGLPWCYFDTMLNFWWLDAWTTLGILTQDK